MSIHTLEQKIKGLVGRIAKWGGERKTMLVYIGILAGASVLSFYLGYAAKAQLAQAAPVVIDCPAEAYISPKSSNLGLRASALSGLQDTGAAAPTSVSGAYMASKNGSKYYPVGCSAAGRIKPENRVFFNSSHEAEASGLSLASGCK